MVGISMIFKTRVKLNHLLAKISSKFKNVGCLFNGSAASCSREGFSHFQHNLSLRSFYPEIWNKQFRYICEKISGHVNLICKTISVFHSVFIKLSDSTTKSFKNPLQNFLTIVRNFQNAMVIGISITCAIGCVDVMADKITAFTINKSSQISQIQRSNISEIVRFKFGHENPFVENQYSLNESSNFCHAERLNKVTFHSEKMRKSELCGNAERRIRRGFPAVEIQSVGVGSPKVTECLNEAARLLAQNLGQTMDEVTRDVLASTSSVLQCSNGGNGNTPTELTYEDISAAVTTLLGNDAEMISEVITSEGSLFGTTPIRPAFWGFIDTDLLTDLENVGDMFIPTAQYASQQTVLESELTNSLAQDKSLVIDLELLFEDNKAQAEAEMLLAA